ncbi:hypothetical protein AKJ58_01485 [candidate division MSBL1 archaeon SCGC-AAA385D11]|uniref:IrrE N-terminal-like domain-containing protein n=1 Tax=candidate division MSBL1 archaeon SCGC-AAA385D11 TaxID=1698286 RepID=A0A133VNB6_9EURY|nr:hypothetical protein AKJ58_01485 [candidate division MSBL1 archaeon SCGC-AAA385D11]
MPYKEEYLDESVIRNPEISELVLEVSEKVLEEEIPPRMIIYASDGVNESHVDEDRVYFSTRDFEKLDRTAGLGLVAHEIAHVCLKHGINKEPKMADEKEADSLATRWGFKEEIEKLRKEFPLK